MKTACSLVAVFVGLTSVVAADKHNVTITDSRGDAHEGFVCTSPPGAAAARVGFADWFYNSGANGPYKCTNINDNFWWSMLNAYRAGGTEGVHWKYTNRVLDPDCLWDWKYYSSDGQTLIAEIGGSLTTLNDSRQWCAMRVYRPGGIEGKQWAYCACHGQN